MRGEQNKQGRYTHNARGLGTVTEGLEDAEQDRMLKGTRESQRNDQRAS